MASPKNLVLIVLAAAFLACCGRGDVTDEQLEAMTEFAGEYAADNADVVRGSAAKAVCKETRKTKQDALAITICDKIFICKEVEEPAMTCLLVHEAVHVRQFSADLPACLLRLQHYGASYFVRRHFLGDDPGKAYRDSPKEIEALHAQRDCIIARHY